MENLKEAKVLVCDDDENTLVAIHHFLNDYVDVLSSFDHPQHLSPIKLNQYDILLMDMNYAKGQYKGEEGFYWLKEFQEKYSNLYIVCMTNHADVEVAVQALHNGATDFILKPIIREKLFASINNAMKLKKSKEKIHQLQSQNNQLIHVLNGPSNQIIGQSPIMEKIKRDIEKVAPTEASVLILGENGTGKDLIANEIHNQSQRARRAFICVDMGSLNENIFESELFGHIKGAYTGASQDRIGRLELSHKGSIFLDEIANINLTQQAKLLRALETKQITKAGSNTPISIDTRVIAATNKPIYRMVEEESFRQDLLFRMNTIEIQLPALRERSQDIPLLLDHFLTHFGKKYEKDFKKPQEKLIKKLQDYSWPGNIRELRHLVERAVIMADSQRLQPEDFHFATTKTMSSKPSNQLDLSQIEYDTIVQALKNHQGNISKAARDLNISRYSLYRKMERHQIKG